jgi:hypothetical protein
MEKLSAKQRIPQALNDKHHIDSSKIELYGYSTIRERQTLLIEGKGTFHGCSAQG